MLHRFMFESFELVEVDAGSFKFCYSSHPCKKNKSYPSSSGMRKHMTSSTSGARNHRNNLASFVATSNRNKRFLFFWLRFSRFFCGRFWRNSGRRALRFWFENLAKIHKQQKFLANSCLINLKLLHCLFQRRE